MKLAVSIIATTLLVISAGAQTRPAARKTVQPTYQQPTATTSSTGWSYGNPFKHEVDLNLSQGYFRTTNVGGKNISDLYIAASYSYDIGHNIQVGGDASFQSYDSTTRLSAVGTGTYNLDANYADSIFFKSGVGLFPVTKLTNGKLEDKNEIGLYIAAGKRFKLWDHVNYKPVIMIAKISDLDAQFIVQFLNVSLNFN